MKETQPLLRRQHSDDDASVFSRIYEEDCNMSCWQRELPAVLSDYAARLPEQTDPARINLKQVLPLASVRDSLHRVLPDAPGRDALVDDIYLLTDMFSCLFELDEVGIRLALLTRPMCPRFHVDHIPCRLVTSWSGNATQWMPQPLQAVEDLDTDDSNRFQQLSCGDVALIKGDGWYQNQGNGLVHRSPGATPATPRLFMSLDFA